ncbi:proton-coupled folate transporter-like [Pocillopora damicornis]|uniref:proton-coupled folate transporter-like n=1 Tax=Pocillopora damicornis TaxID=46731 RepID=UPI000F552EA4|nr:proton-coupled folate transporter-like [Pocillopora damicornis]
MSSEEPVTANEIEDTPNGTTGTSSNHQPISWRNNPHRLLTVEIVIFLYLTGIILEIPVIQQYLYHRAREELKVPGEDENDTICNPRYENSSEHSMDDKVHKKASQYILWVSMTLTLPAIFTACFLGSWSDKRGRKGPMITASVGSALDALIILAAIHWKLPIYVFMIASALAGLGGYYPTMVLALLAYVADTSPPDSRALRLGILEAIAFICGTVVYFVSGVWIKNYGYQSIYLVILSLHLLNLVYVVILLPESLPQELKKNKAVLSCNSIKTIFTVYFKKRLGRWVLITLLVCAVVVYLAGFVVQTLLVLFGKRDPLCWESSVIGYFLGTALFSKAVGAVVGIKLCSCLGVSNFGAVQIGIIFLMGSLIMIGFSINITSFIVFLFWFVFCSGSLFAVLASLESLCNFFSQLIFNPLYTWTVTELTGEYVAGITFFINAGLLLIPMALILVIQRSKPSKPKEFPPLLDNENPAKSYSKQERI